MPSSTLSTCTYAATVAALFAMILAPTAVAVNAEQPPAPQVNALLPGGEKSVDTLRGEPSCSYYYGYGCKCLTIYTSGCYFYQKQCMEDVDNKDGTKTNPSVTWTCAASTKESAWQKGRDSVCADAKSADGRAEVSNALAFAGVLSGRPTCYNVNDKTE